MQSVMMKRVVIIGDNTVEHRLIAAWTTSKSCKAKNFAPNNRNAMEKKS